MRKTIKSGTFYLLLFFCISILLIGSAFSQTKTNLEVFYSLVDSSVARFITINIPPSKIKAEMNSGDVYAVFNNQLLGDLNAKGITTLNNKNDSLPVFSYSIEKSFTNYTNIFRDGFLGAFLVQREISLKGNYLYSGSGKQEFEFSSNDTVRVDDIKNLENVSYKFTNGTIPPEPFFTGLFEPVAALGTAAAAVILFFTVRSK
jgi:hypothetical protein